MPQRLGEVAYKLGLPGTMRFISLLESTTLMAELSHPHIVTPLDEASLYCEPILNHRTVKRGRKTEVEYLLTLCGVLVLHTVCGYGTAYSVWQEDLEQLGNDYWDSKPESERLVLLLFHLLVLVEGTSMVFACPPQLVYNRG